MRTQLLIVALAVLGMACQEDDTPQVPSTIKHVLLVEAAPFHYLKNFEIDFNQDSLIDFQFTVGLEYSGGAEHTKFIVNSLRDGKILLLESAAMAYLPDTEIGPDVNHDNAVWEVHSGELLVKSRYESGESLWNGNWKSNPEGYLAICFKVNGAYHYGWVKLLADTEHQEILIQEYAYNSTPGESIKTGQRE